MDTPLLPVELESRIPATLAAHAVQIFRGRHHLHDADGIGHCLGLFFKRIVHSVVRETSRCFFQKNALNAV